MRAADDQAGLLERLAVGLVDLVAVAVPLVGVGRPVGAGDDRALDEGGPLRAEAHRAAEVTGALDERLLLLHRRDDGRRCARVELGRARTLDAGDGAGVLDDHALQAQADAQGRHELLAGPAQRADLALDAAHAEPAGHEHGVHAAERLLRAGLGLARVARDPADAHLGVVVEAARAQRLGDREVGVGQVDVLADERDLDLVLGLVDPLEEQVPVGPVDVAEGEAEPADDVRVQPFSVQDLRDVVDARRVDGGRDGLGVDVAHQR